MKTDDSYKEQCIIVHALQLKKKNVGNKEMEDYKILLPNCQIT